MSYENCIIRFHYEGRFVGEGSNLKYVNETVDDLTFDPDKVSFFELMNVCENAGFMNIRRIFYLIPGRTIGDGLRLVWDDDTTLDMIGYMLDYGVVDIFIDHGIDEPEIILNLPATDEPAEANRGDSEVEVEDVNDRNKNDSEVEVDIEYLSGSEDEEIAGARSKFQKIRKMKKRTTREEVGEGVDEEKEYHSEYYDFEEYGDPVSDEEEKVDDATRTKGKFPMYDPTTNVPYIELAMLFENSQQFKHAVSLLSIHTNRAIIWAKNHKNFVRGKCSTKGCPWVIYASYDKKL